MTPKDLVNEAVALYAPLQVYSELVRFASFLQGRQFNNILEIGSHRCGTLHVLGHHADRRIISIDQNKFETRKYQEHFLTRAPNALLIAGDSHQPETMDKLVAALAGETIDLLFIDGDHSRAGVMEDFEDYSPLVRSGGFIVFHDVDPNHGHTREPYDAYKDITALNHAVHFEIIDTVPTPGFPYDNPQSLWRIIDILLHDPVFFVRHIDLKGLPPGFGGIGVMTKP